MKHLGLVIFVNIVVLLVNYRSQILSDFMEVGNLISQSNDILALIYFILLAMVLNVTIISIVYYFPFGSIENKLKQKRNYLKD